MTTDLNELADRLIAEPQAEETTPETGVSDDTAAEKDPQEAGEASEDVADDDAQEAEAEAADDAEDDAEDAEVDEQPQKYTVKVGGVETEVTLDELTRSYSGQEFIQRGMQEAATRKKEAEGIIQQVEQMREQFLQTVQAYQAQGHLQEPQAPDPAMIQSDPYAYMQAEAQYRVDKQAFDQQRAMIDQQMQQQRAMQDRMMQERLAAEREKMVQMIPELGDEAKRAEFTANLVRGAQEHYGMTAEEMGQVYDARHVSILADAMKWRQMQATKPAEAPKPTKSVKPKAKMKRSRSQVRQQMKQQARKSQSLSDFADLLAMPQED